MTLAPTAGWYYKTNKEKVQKVHNNNYYTACIAGKISGRVLFFFFHCMTLDCFRARLQGLEVTGNMALKTSGNPLRKHQQSTGWSVFQVVSESDYCPLLHFGCFGSKITFFHYFQTIFFFFWKVFYGIVQEQSPEGQG